MKTHIWTDWLTTAIYLAVLFLALMMFLQTGAATGPNCPDKDPLWLGYCNKAPEAL